MKSPTKYSSRSFRKWLTVVAFSLGVVFLDAGERTFDFEDDPAVSDSLEYESTGEIWSQPTDYFGTGNDGEFLIITHAQGSQSTTIVFPDIDDGKSIKAFTLSCDIRIGNGTTGRPADGFSISYARADDPLLNGNLGAFGHPGVAEAGSRTGVAVSFDTWQGNQLQDGSPDYEGVYVTVDGVPAGGVRMNTRHGECDDPDSLQTGPRTQNNDAVKEKYPELGDWGGNPDVLCWQPLEINLDDTGLLTVKYKGNVILDRFQSNFFPSPGQLVMAGRTGGANELKHVDNIVLKTELADKALFSGFSDSGNGFTLMFRDIDNSQIDADKITLMLDGAAVTPDSVSKEGEITMIVYSQDALFDPNSEHTVSVSAQTTDGDTIAKDIPFKAPNYTLVGAEHKLAGTFSKRGFKMRVLQAQPDLATNTALRERHLAGLLTDADGNVYENLIDYEAGGYEADEMGYVPIDGVINFSADNENGDPEPQGVFREGGTGGVEATDNTDDYIPGIPGLRADNPTDQITAEILTVVEVPAPGIYKFAFNSDDGFKTTAGNATDQLDAIYLGGFDGGRGASTTTYDVGFAEAGHYLIRNIWYERGNGANLEWWLANEDGTPLALFNDDANGGWKTFQEIPDSLFNVVAASPSPGSNNVSPTAEIEVVVQAAITPPLEAFTMTVDGAAITPTIEPGEGRFTLRYQPEGIAASGVKRNVMISVSLPQLQFAASREWSYTTVSYKSLDCATGSPVGSGLNRGFHFNTFQGGGGIGNVQTAEARLISTGENGADPASGMFEEVVNFEQDGNPQGWFRENDFEGRGEWPDDRFPGIPDGVGQDQIAIEFTAYVEFPEAGYYRMGVRSDDGFKVSNAEQGDSGPDEPANKLGDALGFFNAGRSSGETAFDFAVPVAGVYPMRLVWYEGSGGADLEWYSFVDGARVLLNADNGLKAYAARNETALDCPVASDVSVVLGEDGAVTITYEGGMLSSSDKVTGPYMPVAGATSPYSIMPEAGTAQFYKVFP